MSGRWGSGVVCVTVETPDFLPTFSPQYPYPNTEMEEINVEHKYSKISDI